MKKIALFFFLSAICVSVSFATEFEQEKRTLQTKTATVSELVDALFASEVECPFPQYKMTREAFGIDSSTKYTLKEKATLIYRARELRRGMSLAVEVENKEWARAKAKSATISVAEREAHARETTNMKRDFLSSDKGRKMVAFLKTKTVSPEDLVDYLSVVGVGSSAVSARGWAKEAGKDFAKLPMSERVNILYRKVKGAELDKAERRASRKSYLIPKNEDGKPPVVPYRVNKGAISR